MVIRLNNDKVLLEYRCQNTIAIVKMYNPKALNARDYSMLQGLVDIFSLLKNENDLKSVILTGEGENFSAGGDISEFDFDYSSAKDVINLTRELYYQIERFPKPVIVAVDGFAIGGGMELVLASDLIIASEKARFGLGEINIGLISAYGLSKLPVAIGLSRAKQLLFSGKTISSKEAFDYGLLFDVVPADKLLQSSIDLATRIAEKAPLALNLLKESLSNFAAVPYDYALDQILGLFFSQDFKEGKKSFLEKRKPIFRGL